MTGERERLAGERERLAGERERRGEDLRGGERDLPRRGEGDLEAGALRQCLEGRSVVRGKANRVRTRTAGKVHDCHGRCSFYPPSTAGAPAVIAVIAAPVPVVPPVAVPVPVVPSPSTAPAPAPTASSPARARGRGIKVSKSGDVMGQTARGKGHHLLNSTRTRFPNRSLPSLSLTASRCDWNRPGGITKKLDVEFKQDAVAASIHEL